MLALTCAANRADELAGTMSDLIGYEFTADDVPWLKRAFDRVHTSRASVVRAMEHDFRVAADRLESYPAGAMRSGFPRKPAWPTPGERSAWRERAFRLLPEYDLLHEVEARPGLSAARQAVATIADAVELTLSGDMPPLHARLMAAEALATLHAALR